MALSVPTVDVDVFADDVSTVGLPSAETASMERSFLFSSEDGTGVGDVVDDWPGEEGEWELGSLAV